MKTGRKNRRRFVAEVATLAGGLRALQRSSLAMPGPGEGEEYWTVVRRLFPFQEEKVPMNAANLCPSPISVSEAVADYTRDIDVDCSFNNRAQFSELLKRSRHGVADHLGVSADEVALVRNTSEGNNVINSGIDLGPGDEVVVWDQNHPTNRVAWKVRAQRYNFSVREVTTPPSPRTPEELIEPFLSALTTRTRVLALTHVSNVTGVRLPIAELCRLARQRGIYTHVDGAQSWGALNVNLYELGCDSYAASAHKWFVGPKEAGLLYIRKEKIPEIWPSIVAPSWGADTEPDPVGARKFESLGQRDDACLASMADTIDFHTMIGSHRVESRVIELAGYLKFRLKELGTSLVTPEKPELSGGVCIIQIPPDKRQKVNDFLYEEHGIAGAPTGGLRLCPHVYNTKKHIDRAVRGVEAAMSLI